MSSLSRFLQYKSQKWKSAFAAEKHYDNIRSRKVNSAHFIARPNELCAYPLLPSLLCIDRHNLCLDRAKECLDNLSVNRKAWLNQTSRKFLWLPREFCIHFIHCMKTLLVSPTSSCWSELETWACSSIFMLLGWLPLLYIFLLLSSWKCPRDLSGDVVLNTK